MQTVTIEFENEELAEEWLTWMQEQGEQDMNCWDPLADVHCEYDTDEMSMTVARQHADGYSGAKYD